MPQMQKDYDKVIITCAICGKQLLVYPSIARLLEKGIITCSADCATKAVMGNN